MLTILSPGPHKAKVLEKVKQKVVKGWKDRD
jgi:hypothetical protein